MYVCGMVLRCAGKLKAGLSLAGPVTANLTTTVVHSSKLLINDVKPDHSYILILLADMKLSMPISMNCLELFLKKFAWCYYIMKQYMM